MGVVKVNDGFYIAYVTPDDGYSYFFGYYDKSPLSGDNKKLLSHRVGFDGREVRDGDVADVGYFKIDTGEFVIIDKTFAWNWQQGAQLQWVPDSSYKKVIYNQILDNRFVSIIYDLDSKEKKVIPFSIYALHPNGKEALGIVYERHYWCRPGYNYKNIANPDWNLPWSKKDGIFRIDLLSGEVEKIIGIEEIINYKRLGEFESCNNWLEHIMYNPSGSRFMFFHRWCKDGKDYSRVFTANSKDGKDLFMLPDNRFYSHYSWVSNNELSIWTVLKQKNISARKNTLKKKSKDLPIAKLLLKITYAGIKLILPKKIKNSLTRLSHLVIYIDQSSDYSVVGRDYLFGNGHQSWFSDKKRLVNDTYQDKEGYRHLMIFDVVLNNLLYIGKFFSMYNDCVYRCDLHPRLSDDNKFIVIDSAHEAKRKILVIGRCDD